VQVRVRTAAGVSAADTLAVAARAPRLFSVDQAGSGRAVLTHADGNVATRQRPIKPGQFAVIYLNSVGAVDPPIAAGMGAGDGSPGNPFNRVTETVAASIDGKAARVDFAGLVPYLTGLYQVNVLTPYYDVIGDVPIEVSAGAQATQGNISVPVEPNGFYWVVTAGKFVNGQTLNGVAGPGSAIAFSHDDAASWGPNGHKAWTKQTGLGAAHRACSGLALTLKSGATIVYDNNGIEDGTHGGYYDNRGGVPDADKPGLWIAYSMSNNFNAVFAGYFRLAARTTFNQVIGYFDGNGNPELRFDPASIYNRYRMNIWSNASGDVPTGPAGFTGNVFSSDRTAGKSAFSATGVNRVFRDGASDPIYRLAYTLDAPFTLEAGEYWFSHDVAVPEAGVSARPTGTPRSASSAKRPRPASLIEPVR